MLRCPKTRSVWLDLARHMMTSGVGIENDSFMFRYMSGTLNVSQEGIFVAWEGLVVPRVQDTRSLHHERDARETGDEGCLSELRIRRQSECWHKRGRV